MTSERALVPGGQYGEIEFRTQILDRSNYVIWKRHMKNVLEAKGLLETTETEVVGSKEHKARALLTSSLSADNQMKVINCETAYKIWKRLESIYENKTSFEKETLIGKLHTYKISSASQLSNSISEMENIVAKLRMLGEDVSDQSFMTAILRALPSSFSTFIKIWKGTNVTERTIENLITRLLAEVEDERSPGESAFISNRKSPYRRGNRQFNRNKNIECNFCKKKGHIARDCYKLKAKQHNPGNQFNGHQFNHKQQNLTHNNNYPNTRTTPNRGFRRKNNNNHGNEIGLVATELNTLATEWIVDSGASIHMTRYRNWLDEYKKFDEPIKVSGISEGIKVNAEGCGKIHLSFGTMYDVYYVPDASTNLLSESCAARKGFKIISEGDSKKFILDDEIIFKAYMKDKLYVANLELFPCIKGESGMKAATLETWHRRLGHVSKDTIRRMATTKAVNGLEISNSSKDKQCISCIMGKCHKISHMNRTTPRATLPGQVLHMDTIGPIEQASIGHSKYALLVKDEFSSYRMIYFLSSKHAIPEVIKLSLNKAHEETGTTTTRVVSDNGTKFTNRDIQSYFMKQQITHDCSVPYTPEQNGFIERDIRSIKESARTMLHESKLPHPLWAEAMNTAVYTMNRTISRDTDVTPYQKWFGRKPDIRNLRVFGQKVVALKQKNQRSTFDAKGEILQFVGYSKRLNTYRLYSTKFNTVEEKCDVTFLDLDSVIPQNNNEVINNETNDDFVVTTDKRIGSWEEEQGSSEGEAKTPTIPNRSSSLVKERSDIQQTPRASPRTNQMAFSSENPSASKCKNESMVWEQESLSLRSDDRPIKPMTKNLYEDPDFSPRKAFNDQSLIYSNVSDTHDPTLVPRNLLIGGKPPTIKENRTRGDDGKPKHYGKLSTIERIDDPENYEQAIKRDDKEQWLTAMSDEIHSLKKNNVYEVVERPNDSIVTSRWVFVTKRKPNGEIDRYKARLVARGFSQVYGLDYKETFAPVVNSNSIRLLLAYAAVEKLKLGQFDVKTAFLYGELEEEIYMEPPEGIDEGKAWLLKRSLYGLKQAPRQWNKKFHDTLKNLNLRVSDFDDCIYYRKEPLLIIAIYVDDGIILSRDEQEIDKTMDLLRRSFEMTSTDLNTFLGFQIERSSDGAISIHQESYVRNMLKRYKMEDCKSVNNPCGAEISLLEERPLQEEIPFREAIGSLMYAAVNTRIDIAYAVGKVSRKVSQPTENDWKAVKRIFRYLKGKEKLGITYSYTRNEGMIAYCDADFAGDVITAKSTTGMAILYGGGPICWKSKRQSLVSTSTTEAELVSMSYTIDEVSWIRNLALELNIVNQEPIPILCDNQSTVRIVENERSIHRTRHMRVKAAAIREIMDNGIIQVSHVKAEKQAADMLTKATTAPMFIKNRNLFMTFLTIIILITIIKPHSCKVFDRVAPILWQHTNKYVGSPQVHYVIQLHFLNPCELLRRTPKPGPVYGPVIQDNRMKRQLSVQPQMRQQPIVVQTNVIKPPDMSSDWNYVIQGAVELCNTLYGEQITSHLEKMRSQLPPPDMPQEASPDIFTTRKKRSVLAFVIGMFMSNILKTATNFIWDGNDEKETESRAQFVTKELNELQNRINMTLEIEKAEKDAIKNVALIAHETRAQLSRFIHTFPRVSFASQYFAAHISEIGRLLAQLQYKNQPNSQVDLILLRQLINDDKWLSDVEPSSTQLKLMGSNTPNTFRLQFLGRKRDKNCIVYKVIPFKFLANLASGRAALMEYRGPEYVMYNKINHDVRRVPNAANDVIVGTDCSKTNKADNSLSAWYKIAEYDNPYDSPLNTTFIESYPWTYVLCYPHNITFTDGTCRCPSYVMRINSTYSWNTTDGERYEPSTKEYLVYSVRIEYKIPDVHFKTVEHLNDENQALDKIFELTGKIKALERENIAVTLPVAHGGLTYAQMMYLFVMASLLMFILIIYVIIHKTKSDRRRHDQVMRTVTDSAYGNGTYETIRIQRKAAKKRSRSSPGRVIKETLQIGTQNVFTAPRRHSNYTEDHSYDDPR